MNLIVNGGKGLKGTIEISKSKNATLPIVAAAFLFDRKSWIKNAPEITDVQNLINLGRKMGGGVYNHPEGKGPLICKEGIKLCTVMPDEGKNLRGSYYLIPAALHLNKNSIFSCPLPGGCNLGERKINYHIEIFEEFGCSCRIESNRLYISPSTKKKDQYFIDVHGSLGATINSILMAISYNSSITIENYCTDPEVKNFLDFIKSHYEGSVITWGKTKRIDFIPTSKINDEIGFATAEIIDDRIEHGTYSSLQSIMPKIKIKSEQIGHGSFEESLQYLPLNLETNNYPGLQTDFMPLLIPSYLMRNSTISITDRIFPNRPKGLLEFKNFGADVEVGMNWAIVKPGQKIHPGCACAHDLRLGAALTIMALCIPGKSVITNFEQVLRGYESIVEKLRQIGSDIYLE